MCTVTPLIYILCILISIFNIFFYFVALCDLSSESALFLDNNLTFLPPSILFLKTRISNTIDPLFARTSLPLNTFARGYQLPLLWSWICCKTGSKLSAEQVPQHAVSFGAKILFKIVLGQYLTLRWDACRCFCVYIRAHTLFVYVCVAWSVWPFSWPLRLYSSSAVMSACVRGYACES